MTDIEERIANLSPEKRRLLELRLNRTGDSTTINTIPHRTEDAPTQLSFAQERMWVLNQLEQQSPVYNEPKVIKIRGRLDLPILHQCLETIFARHATLRTTFCMIDGQPVQVVADQWHFDLPYTDLRDDYDPSATLQDLLLKDITCIFDLSKDLMLRGAVYQIGDEEYILLLVNHHIASDYSSTRILFRELSQLYQAFSDGLPNPLPELPIQYTDYATWQRQRLSGARLEKLLDYWKLNLQGLPALNLPTDHPRPAIKTYAGAVHRFSIPANLTDQLRNLSRTQGTTLYMTLLSALFVLLHRYSGQNDFCIGSPVANRTRSEIEGLIGFFINTLALRVDLSNNPSFCQLLQYVRKVVLGALENQELPFEKLVEELQPERSLQVNPLFQVLFNMLRESTHELFLPGMSVERLRVHSGTSKFDLSLYLNESENGLRCEFEFDTDIFEPDTIEHLANHYQNLIQAILNNPQQPVGNLPLMTSAERHQVLTQWNETTQSYPDQSCNHQLFESQVARTPERPAVFFNDTFLTYTQLNQRANQLAHFLQSNGVGQEVLIGLCLERSPELIVALLAVLKAGGVCLPLDPTYPLARLDYILHEAQAPLIITQSSLRQRLPDSTARVLCLDEALPDSSTENLPALVSPENLVYVLYTSGSTGQPKGVAMPHRTLVNLVSWQLHNSTMGIGSRTLQFTPLTFDVSFQEIFSTLCYGGALVLISEELRRDPAALLAYLQEKQVERLFLPFVALQQLAEVAQIESFYPHSLREVITAGEQLRITPQIAGFFKHVEGCSLHNHYGPTESHVATAYTLPGRIETWPDLPPIGRPIANTQIYLLDSQMQPVPVGVYGELYIAGDCLARGYLNRPDLTAERFIPNPFSSIAQKNPPEEPSQHLVARSPDRLYKTGDLARYLPDGVIEFLGRRDHQVKIRGFRVELGEIEAVLGRHPAISQAVVFTHQEEHGPQRLVAYLVPVSGQKPSASELRSYLADLLPDYMLPSDFVFLDALPLTPSGKVDRLRLPAPQRESTPLAPRDPLEVQLVSIWEELLGVHPVGVEDNFFELGGHSLLAIRLFHQIERRLGVSLPVASLFKAPTIIGLASLARQGKDPFATSCLVPIQPAGDKPPFFCVHGFDGLVIGYHDLANQLGADQPFIGLQAVGVSPGQPFDTTIEDMAYHYIQAMHQHQPKGPYRLGGYCFGGLIAYEMARQLSAQGESIALLAIMEGYAPAPRTHQAKSWQPSQVIHFLRNLPFWLDDFLKLGFNEMSFRARRRLNLLTKRWLRRLGFQIAANPQDYITQDLSDVPQHLRKLMEVHINAMQQYSPPSFPGKVSLFRGRRLSLLRGGDPLMGWGKLAMGGVVTYPVEGAHNNIHLSPFVQSLAGQLRASLEEETEKNNEKNDNKQIE